MCYRACTGTIDRTASTEKISRVKTAEETPLGKNRSFPGECGESSYVNGLQRELCGFWCAWQEYPSPGERFSDRHGPGLGLMNDTGCPLSPPTLTAAVARRKHAMQDAAHGKPNH
jgi:hypothetical protein